MRNRFLSFLALVTITTAGLAKISEASTEKGAQAVKGSGCVAAGVEAKCLVLTDLKTGKEFNLFFKAKPPQVGDGIQFEGTVHGGPTICMQGTPVDVTKWSIIKIHCPQETSPTKAK